MQFVHTAYVPGKTCAAIATAPGEGGIAVIRISGTDAISVAAKICRGPVESYKSHTARYTKVQTPGGVVIDDVLVLVMRAPRSFTGEDTVEIHCHGGNLIPKQILEAAISAGASPALGGEFSFKAFMNGKIDLLQAEAIQAKIAAKNELALSAACEQMEGTLSKKVSKWQEELFNIAAIFEAWVDFPEEGLEFSSFSEVNSRLQSVRDEIQHLVGTFCRGRIISEGIAVCIVGSPNVGKSSLLNALVGKERAIVSDIAGTTRDIVEDQIRLNGLHLRLIDTAGIRETSEVIEQEGIRRSKRAVESSDIVLLVLDVTREYNKEAFFDELPKEKTIAIWNKVDLEHVQPLPELPFEHVAMVSAKAESGFDMLHKAIDSIIWKADSNRQSEAIVTSYRHKEALDNAIEAINRVLNGLEAGVSCEFIAFDMRQALSSLGIIIGTDVTDEIITAVFSSFCLGK